MSPNDPPASTPNRTGPKLLDRVRDAIRTRHYSRRTEEAYVHWIRRYIVFHRKTHPSEMGATEISQFLTSLAVERHVSASTQNQALSALLFLYQRGGRVAVAVRLSRGADMPERPVWAAVAISPARVGRAEGGGRCRAAGRHPQARPPAHDATASRRTCWKTGTTFARCRNCSVIGT